MVKYVKRRSISVSYQPVMMIGAPLFSRAIDHDCEEDDCNYPVI